MGIYPTEAYECQTYDNDRFSYTKEECRDGNLLHKLNYSKEDNRLFSKSTFSLGRISKKESYSATGHFNYKEFHYNSKTVIETSYIRNSRAVIKRKTEKLLYDQQIVANWKYENGQAIFKDSFKSKLSIKW